MQSESLLDLIRRITADDSRTREIGADAATDWVDRYSPTEGQMLATLLAICAASERDFRVLESQLNALLQLGSINATDSATLSPLHEINRTQLPAGLAEYLDDLLEEEK